MPVARSVLPLGLILGLLPFAAGTAQEAELPVPTEWTTHYAWFLVANPDHRPTSHRADSVLTAAHIQYQLRLQRDGQAIVAGGFGPGEDDRLIGLTILRAPDLDSARALAEADPAVRAGRLLARVREWWVPSGRLP